MIEDFGPKERAIQQFLAASTRSLPKAYLLCVFFGFIGGHRAYLNDHRTGDAMLGLWGIAAMLLALSLHFVSAWLLAFGLAFTICLAVWWLVDLIRLPWMVDEINRRSHAEADHYRNLFITPMENQP